MTALDKATRRKVFYAMAAVFAVVAPLALLYSRGYLVDLRGRGIVATGGIFVRTVQPGVRIAVEGGASRETSFISQGALITDLLPRRYVVRAEKDGRRAWEKVVRVSGQEVLEFRNVFLPPATLTPQFIFAVRTSGPARLIGLPGRPEIGLEVGAPDQPFTAFAVHPGEHRARFNFIRAVRWSWDETSQTFYLARLDQGLLRWFRVNAAAADPKEERIAFRGLPAGFTADTLLPHPTAAGEFYFSAGGALFLQGRSSVPVPIAEEVHAYAATRQRLYFVSRNGFFVETSLTGQDTRVLGRKGLVLDSAWPSRIGVSPAGDIIVLDSAGGLFRFRPGRDEELGFVSGNVLGFDFSASGDRMLYWDEHRLSIYWLRDSPRQPFDLAGSKKNIFYSAEPIRESVLSADGANAILRTDGAIRMTEVDDRGGVNSYELVSDPVDASWLDKNSFALYWIEERTLYRASLK